MRKKTKSKGMNLNLAISIAASAHQEQFDSQGEPFVLHPLSVMKNVEKYAWNPKELEVFRITSVLHDLFEDTNWKLINVRHSHSYYAMSLHQTNEPLMIEEHHKLSYEIFIALGLLTHEKNEPYMEYIKKIGANLTATVTKMADLEHNMDPTRFKPDDLVNTIRRNEKYCKAFSYLKNRLKILRGLQMKGAQDEKIF